MKIRGWTVLRLAMDIGKSPSAINNFLYGQRKPDQLSCLLLAAVAPDESKGFFIAASGLTERQLELISSAAGPGPERSRERKRA